MATVYSLVCWGGCTGKVVTMTIASPCVVTSTNHGLRDGGRLVFETTGALPTGITAGVTYYAKKTSEDAFNLYTDLALTNIVNTSGSQSGTHTAKSVVMAELFAAYPGRWGVSGSERCYDSLGAWFTARTSSFNYFTDELVELGEAFRELYSRTSGGISTGSGRRFCTITSVIDGVPSEAHHRGRLNAGFSIENLYTAGTMYSNTLGVLDNSKVEGFTVVTEALTTSSTTSLHMTPFNTHAKDMIAINSLGNNKAITVGSTLSTVSNCIALGAGLGFNISPNVGSSYQVMTNCLASKCSIGYGPGGANTFFTYMFNCISYKNTLNWANVSGLSRVITNNASDGITAWMTGPGSVRFTCTDADFVSIGTTTLNLLTDDFRPSSSSILINNGFTEHEEVVFTDITTAVRPSYNNGGPEGVDIGPYEFDNGFGPHPATSTISLTNIVSGSRVLITRNDTHAVLYNDVPGASLSLSTGYIGAFTVIIRKASDSPYYREFQAGGTTVADQTTTIQALQQLDE